MSKAHLLKAIYYSKNGLIIRIQHSILRERNFYKDVSLFDNLKEM